MSRELSMQPGGNEGAGSEAGGSGKGQGFFHTPPRVPPGHVALLLPSTHLPLDSHTCTVSWTFCAHLLNAHCLTPPTLTVLSSTPSFLQANPAVGTMP